MNKQKKTAKQVVIFILVGAANTFIDLLVLNLLIFASHTGKTGATYDLFKTISFLVALANSYLMNRAWTFKSSAAKKQHIEVVQFVVTSTIGLIINVVVAGFAVRHLHFQGSAANLAPSVAALCGTAVGLIWNFVGYKYFVFAEKQGEIFPPV